MGGQHQNHRHRKKKLRPTERESTTPLFLLRCLQIGLRLSDLDELDMGMVYDLITEKGNDSYNYAEIAGQADFDAF